MAQVALTLGMEEGRFLGCFCCHQSCFEHLAERLLGQVLEGQVIVEATATGLLAHGCPPPPPRRAANGPQSFGSHSHSP